MSSKNCFTPSNQLLALGLWACSFSFNDASNSRSRVFCFSLRLTGVSTTTRHMRSPTSPPCTERTPLPRKRNNWPDWVSAAILSFPRPSRVGTSSSPPRAAVMKLMGTSQYRLLSSRVKIGCSLTFTYTYKSPAGPPCSPASPSPASRMRSPLSTPGGIFTCRVLCSWTRPWPWQLAHGSLITLPLPRQRGQVCCSEKKPCCIRTWPTPPQVVQVTGLLPLAAPEPAHTAQSTSIGTRIFTAVPCTASSRLSSRL